ncbi:MAG: FG-GAP repeat domain-containing protein, partial [Planctomycetota bacterium]
DRAGWSADAAALAPAVQSLRNDALVAWATRDLAALPRGANRASVSDATIEAAAASWRRFEPWLDTDDLRIRLPIAEIAYWLASAEAARLAAAEQAGGDEASVGRHRAQMSYWVAAAWQEQPLSPAVGRGLLLLADHQLAHSESVEQAQQLVQQYAAAATMNAGHEPWLEARALIGLARAQLAVPGAGAPENALIALLRVIQPDGSPRPAYATPPDDDATQLLADAADLLMIARRICAPAGDADNGNVCRLPDGNLCIGSTTGARILVVEQPTDAGALPLRLLQGGRALIGVGVARCEFFNGRADGRTPVAMITVPGHENERVTIADPRDPSSHVVELPHSVIDIVSGDFNGDGLPDVAVVQLDTDDAGVLVSDRQLVIVGLVDANDSVTSAHVVWAGRSPRLRAADLDQDGRDELVICDNGRMAVFDADVAPLGEHDQLDPSKAPVLPSVAVGRTLANVVDMAGQRALAVCGWYSDLELAQRQVAGESMRSRPRFFRYHDGAIDEADAPPWHVRADDRPLPDGRGFEVVRLDAGRIALIDRMQRGNWQLCRWLLADGDARPGGTGSVASHAIGTSCRELGDGVFATPSGFTRRLSDADLAVLATQPLRTGRSGRALQTEDRQLALLRMLLWFGQADTVIASVLPRIQDQYEADPQTQPREQPPAGHPALIGERLALLILQAWLESSQLSCALKLAYALPLQSRYVEHVLLVVDEVLRRSGNVEAVAPLLERWSTGWSLTAGERQRVRSRQRQVTRIIEALQSGAIEIIGRSARFSSHEFDKHVYDVSTIDHFCITNDPALAHATHDGWHMVADGRNYRLAIDADGNTAPPFAGVPIWLSGDVVRMVMDFRLLALEPGATPGIGLFAVRRGTVDRPDTVTGPTADALGIGGGQMLASRIGAKLRLQHDWFGPLGIERVILSDAASGEILSLELRESAGVNSKGTFAIVGVCAGSRGRCELTIERIGLNGNVWLLDDTAPEFEAMMPDDITRRVSSAARLHLSGDSADGIGEMSTLVEWLQTQRPPQYEEESAFRAFDAARWAGDAPAIARVLVRADEVLPANLVPLALRQPQARLDIELWIAVGTVWAGSPRENDAAPDPRRKALEDAELGLALAWAEAKDKRDDAACRANILEAAQRAVEAAQAQGAGTETVALQTHLVAVSRWLAALQPLTAQQRAWQLSALAATGHSRVMQRSLQKEQVTAAGFEAAYGVPSAVPVLDQLTAWLGERAAAQAARARQLGISPTDAIRPRAVDDGGADTPLELMKMWVEFVRSGDAKLLARLVTPEERGMLRPGTPAGRVAELLPRAIHLAPGQEPEVLENTLDRAALTHTLVFRWSATFDDALLREVAHERLIATVCVTRGVGSEEARKVLRDEFSDDEITNMENSLIADVHYDAQDLDMLRQGGRWYMVPPWLVDY